MSIYIILTLFFLIISIILAIHFVLEGNGSMYYGFIMLAYLLARQCDNDVGGD